MLPDEEPVVVEPEDCAATGVGQAPNAPRTINIPIANCRKTIESFMLDILLTRRA